MKTKVVYGVSILAVFALAAVGFSMAPGSVSGAGGNGRAEPLVGIENTAASPTETAVTDAGTEGAENTYYGDDAGSGNTGRYVTFIGAEAGAGSNSGESNTFVGQRCGWQNTSGVSNTFVGRNAGAFNTGGNFNTFMGRAAGYANTTGTDNTFVGYFAGYSTTTIGSAIGMDNTFIGSEAGRANTTGCFNTFIGKKAGRSNDTGGYNTFVGDWAGHQSASGWLNTFIGESAGYMNEDGSGNVLLGCFAGYNETGSNKLYISNSNTSTPLIWGNFESGDRRVVIYGGFRAIASYTSSDGRWKKKIEPLESSLDKVSTLQGVSYEWNRDEYPNMGMTEGKQIGLVAQDVEKVLPELVSEDKDGYKAVSYTKLTAVLVEAIKELKAQNQKQQAEIEALRAMIRESRS